MPSRARMPTGAPFRRAFSQTPMNEKKTAAKMRPTTMSGMAKISGMEFIGDKSGLGYDDAKVVDADHAQQGALGGMAGAAEGLVAPAFDQHIAAGRQGRERLGGLVHHALRVGHRRLARGVHRGLHNHFPPEGGLGEHDQLKIKHQDHQRHGGPARGQPATKTEFAERQGAADEQCERPHDAGDDPGQKNLRRQQQGPDDEKYDDGVHVAARSTINAKSVRPLTMTASPASTAPTSTIASKRRPAISICPLGRNTVTATPRRPMRFTTSWASPGPTPAICAAPPIAEPTTILSHTHPLGR